MYPFLGLAGEAGELCNQVKKVLRDEQVDSLEQLSDSRRAKMLDELGDVLWYAAEICTMLGVEMEEVAAANLTKLARRAENNTLHGDNREAMEDMDKITRS
jgi:NTP pyrophosphatase (non-canonical NTP hydrolase)